MKKLTQEEFLTKVKIIHGDLYDYSMVKYAGMILCIGWQVFLPLV